VFSESVTAAPTTAASTAAAIATSTAAAIATSTTTTTTTAAAIATSTTTTATATATAIFSGLGLIDGEWPAFVVLLVQARNRSLSFGVVSHLDETKSFAAATATVSNHLGTFN
jgi:hypothetical protein